MKEKLAESMQKLTGLSAFSPSLYRSCSEALTKVVLDAYFSTTLLEGKSHFAFIGNFVDIPYFAALEEAYCSVRIYSQEEIEEFSAEIFGPRTALIVVSTADPYTKEPFDSSMILEKALENAIPVHLEISHSIGLQSSFVEEKMISSLSFMTQKIGADLGSILLAQKKYSFEQEYLGADFIEDVLEKAACLQTTFSGRLLALAKKKRLLGNTLRKKIPDFKEIPSLASTLSLSFPKVYGEALAFRAQCANVALIAHPDHCAKVAIELDPMMSCEEIEKIAQTLAENVQQLRKMAGYQ